MEFSAKPVDVREILPWRDLYRAEMNCQIVHDSMHSREGWTQSYLLEAGGAPAGYGSTLIAGPWTGTRTAFEFFVTPKYRSRVFDLFCAFLSVGQATAMEVQTNDALITVMLHIWAHDIKSEKIIFEDKLTTTHSLDSVVFRRRDEPDNDWALELDGAAVARGGILYHYNRPYGDVYMEVAEPFRRRGLGSYLVQELKRVCYEHGSVPCARCTRRTSLRGKRFKEPGLCRARIS